MDEFKITTRFLSKELGRDRSLADSMDVLLDMLAKQRRSTVWKELSKIDWGEELARLASWLTRLLITEPPSAQTDGFFFGLFNPVEKKLTTAEIYVAGYASAFDTEWFEDRPCWWPEARYSGSRAMRQVYALAYRSPRPLDNLVEYPVCLSFACLAAVHLARSLPSELLLRERKACAFGAGFDSGDIFRVGTLRKRGFETGLQFG